MSQRNHAKRAHTPARTAGFSLIELLLVLVIMAILASVVATRFTGSSERARVTAAKTDIASLETALDAFEIDTGRYPTAEEGLSALVTQPSGIPADSWHGPYLKHGGIPKDPWGNAYVYQQPGTHNTNSYDLSSGGADGTPGTDDDVTNWSNENNK